MVKNFATAPSNILPGIQALTGAVESYGEFRRENAKKGKIEQLKKQASELIGQDPEIIAKEVAKNPELRELMSNALGAESDAMLDMSKKYLIEQNDPFELHEAEARKDIIAGRDPSDNIEMARAMLSEKTKAEATKKHETVLMLKDPKAYKAYMAQKSGGVADKKGKLGSQEILEDGTIIQSTSKGPVVYNPQGEKVTGQDAADAVMKARAEKIKNERLKSGGKRTAVLEADEELKGKVEAGVISQKEAAKISVKAFGRLEAINKNIKNLEEGISLLREDGANTGVVDKYLPSIKKASIKMDNLQGRLGLDVLNTTTFGALSAGELKFALDTALPKGLQPKDLADWMEEKKEAQEKLSDYLESVAIYMGTPGNTATSWLKKKREESQSTKKKKRFYDRTTKTWRDG